MEVVMRSRLTIVVGLLVVFASIVGNAQAPAIEGAWRVTEVTGPGAQDTNKSPQPGLYIFSKKHYSIVSVGGTEPRKSIPAAQDGAKLTDAEKTARYEAWEPLTANAGTYEIKGTTLTTHPMVAKNPSVMGQTQTREFKIDGKILTLIQKSTTQPGAETRVVLTRVE
jgi:hypothetical protein